MQTFLPHPDFESSLSCLDYRRLGKQRVEAFQLLGCISKNSTSGWRNHPAARMWRGYAPALRMYMRAAIIEWVHRGYRNTMEIPAREEYTSPSWLYKSSPVCISHQANLVRKDPEYYGAQFPEVDPLMPYHWPEEGSVEHV